MDILITITGLNFNIDSNELNANQEIVLRKEPNNKFDEEAIAVYINDSMKIGYISNSVRTKAKGTYSAGRLYDKIHDEEKAKILVILHDTAIGIVHVDNKKSN